MEEDGHVVIQCDGDVDSTVVSAAISRSSPKTDNPVMVVPDDTDIAIMPEIIFNSKKSEAAWSIASDGSSLEDKEHLLFVHAWSGCDTVSATFGKGKASFLKLVNQSDELKDLSTSISDVCADKYYIGRLSADLFTIMYSGKRHEYLTNLRYILKVWKFTNAIFIFRLPANHFNTHLSILFKTYNVCVFIS